MIERFLRLPAADRTLLVRAVLWLSAARLALWVLPFRTARRLLSGPGMPSVRVTVTPDRVGWALVHARRLVPRATCLPQALAAEALLLRSGRSADLRIGVLKTDAGRLEAHAWVEHEGRIVVGDLDEDHTRYTPLPPLPGAGL